MNRRQPVLAVDEKENRQGAATEERNGGSKTPFALMLGKGSPAAHPLAVEGRLSNGRPIKSGQSLRLRSSLSRLLVHMEQILTCPMPLVFPSRQEAGSPPFVAFAGHGLVISSLVILCRLSPWQFELMSGLAIPTK